MSTKSTAHIVSGWMLKKNNKTVFILKPFLRYEMAHTVALMITRMTGEPAVVVTEGKGYRVIRWTRREWVNG